MATALVRDNHAQSRERENGFSVFSFCFSPKSLTPAFHWQVEPGISGHMSLGSTVCSAKPLPQSRGGEARCGSELGSWTVTSIGKLEGRTHHQVGSLRRCREKPQRKETVHSMGSQGRLSGSTSFEKDLEGQREDLSYTVRGGSAKSGITTVVGGIVLRRQQLERVLWGMWLRS